MQAEEAKNNKLVQFDTVFVNKAIVNLTASFLNLPDRASCLQISRYYASYSKCRLYWSNSLVILRDIKSGLNIFKKLPPRIVNGVLHITEKGYNIPASRKRPSETLFTAYRTLVRQHTQKGGTIKSFSKIIVELNPDSYKLLKVAQFLPIVRQPILFKIYNYVPIWRTIYNLVSKMSDSSNFKPETLTILTNMSYNTIHNTSLFLPCIRKFILFIQHNHDEGLSHLIRESLCILPDVEEVFIYVLTQKWKHEDSINIPYHAKLKKFHISTRYMVYSKIECDEVEWANNQRLPPVITYNNRGKYERRIIVTGFVEEIGTKNAQVIGEEQTPVVSFEKELQDLVYENNGIQLSKNYILHQSSTFP